MGQGQSNEEGPHLTTAQVSHELVCYPSTLKSTPLIPTGTEVRETMLHSPRTLLLPRCLQEPGRSPGLYRIPQRRYDSTFPRDSRHYRRIIDYLPDDLISGRISIRSRCAGGIGIRANDNGGCDHDAEISASFEEGQPGSHQTVLSKPGSLRPRRVSEQ